jgi:hypothetical protein
VCPRSPETMKFDELLLRAASELKEAGTPLTYKAICGHLSRPYATVYGAVKRIKGLGLWPHQMQRQRPARGDAATRRNETVVAPVLPRVLDLDAATMAADRIRDVIAGLSLADRLRVLKALAAYVESELPALEDHLTKETPYEANRREVVEDGADEHEGEAGGVVPAVRAVGA